MPCLGSMVPELLHAMRIVCLLKAVIPAWVTNSVSFTLKIDYIHHSDSFEVLQAKVNCLLLVGPACLKQTLLRSWWTDQCTFHIIQLGLLGEHLGEVSWSSGHPLAFYITFGVYLLGVRTPPTRVVGFRKYTQTA